MKKLILISTLLLLVSCGSKGNKENHGSGVTSTPWCSESYIDERNDLVDDINWKIISWRMSSTLGTGVDVKEVEELLTRTVSFLNVHENTICRGNVLNTCDVLNNPGCSFDFTEEDINNSELVELRNTMVEIISGANP